MTIFIDTVNDASGTARPNLTGISWSLWPTYDVTLPPAEGGVGLSTDGSASLTIPSVAEQGILLLHRNDTDMQGYTVRPVIAIDTPENLQWSEPFPGFYLLFWEWPFAEQPDGFVIERDGESFGATSLQVFVTTQPGTYVVRALNDGGLSPPSNPVTIP